MFINTFYITTLLLCISTIQLNAADNNNWKIKILDTKERAKHTEKYSEPILAIFEQYPILRPEQTIAIEKWHNAHLEFRKQWILLRQTPEYDRYYSLKENRIDAKMKRNATPQGQNYMEAKKNAYELLAKTPSIKISDDIFILVPTEKKGYKLIPRNRIKYTE